MGVWMSGWTLEGEMRLRRAGAGGGEVEGADGMFLTERVVLKGAAWSRR